MIKVSVPYDKEVIFIIKISDASEINIIIMIYLFSGKDCYGCGACADACHVSAITMQKANNGFLIPKIDRTKCIECGLCTSICPRVNSCKNHVDNELFCAKHLDERIRHEGSSGSVFYALAKNHIETNRGLVIGACFDSNLQLKHMMISNVEEIPRLMKSKYIQSDCTGIYRIVKQELSRRKPVLFVGTPCQCQAMMNMVNGVQRDLLTVVDFVCHGVPSQDLFNRCISRFEGNYGCKVTNVSFREKDGKNMRSFLIKGVDKKTGKEIIKKGLPHQWPYYNGFLDHTTYRPSCFNCQFKTKNRGSDLTIGDFWGIESLMSDIKDYKQGYSMVIVNSEKGKQTLKMIDHDLMLCSFPLKVAIDNNYAFAKQDQQSKLSHHFLKYYSHMSICLLESLFLSSNPSLISRCLRKLLRWI